MEKEGVFGMGRNLNMSHMNPSTGYCNGSLHFTKWGLKI